MELYLFCSVQRVLEQRVTSILDKLLVKPSLVNLPPVEQGGLLLVSSDDFLVDIIMQPLKGFIGCSFSDIAYFIFSI